MVPLLRNRTVSCCRKSISLKRRCCQWRSFTSRLLDSCARRWCWRWGPGWRYSRSGQ